MKYKELNIGDWYGRPDLIGFILIRTATSYDDNLPSTRDFVIYPYEYAGDYYFSDKVADMEITLPLPYVVYKSYYSMPLGAYYPFSKGTLFYYCPTPGETTLMLIYGIDNVGICCNGKNAGHKIDFVTTKIVEGPDIVSPKYLNYYEI